VNTRNPPKIITIQVNRVISATPAKIKIPLIIRAPRMPQKRTLCWYLSGTAKNVKMRMKTKILSTLSEYSITYPVRNSRAGVLPNLTKTNRLNSNAKVIQTVLQIKASLTGTSCSFLLKTPRSSASIRNMKT
jgi:hypothetical protein